MAQWLSSYYSSRLHRTFRENDPIIVQGIGWTSTDKNSVGYNYTTPETKYFYGYFESPYSYAPINAGYQINGVAQAQYYFEDSSIVGGGTLDSYTYSFNAAGGSGAPGNQTKQYAVNFTFPSTIPSRAGHTFLGWANSNVNNATIYKAGQTVGGLPDTNIEWWAQWQEWTYTVSYNANGGSGAPGNQTKRYTANLTLSAARPARTGYTFKGWSTSSGGGAAYQPGGTYSSNANVTLYAVWQVNTYTLTVNPNGGTWSGSTSSQSFTQNYSSAKSIPNPSRTGYDFTGWSLSGSGSLSGTTYTYGAGNGTLTANWRAHTYTVAYNGNGNTGGSTGNTGHTYDVSGNLATNGFTKTGHTFKQWNTASNGTGTAYASGQSVRNMTSAGGKTITLYAIWTPNPYTVTFNATANGGTTPEKTRTINYGSKLGTLPAATRKYYKFIGWFTSVSGGNQITSNQVITGNVTYYAQYKIDASLTIHAGGANKPAIVYVKQGGKWHKSLTLVRTGGKWNNSTGAS